MIHHEARPSVALNITEKPSVISGYVARMLWQPSISQVDPSIDANVSKSIISVNTDSSVAEYMQQNVAGFDILRRISIAARTNSVANMGAERVRAESDMYLATALILEAAGVKFEPNKPDPENPMFEIKGLDLPKALSGAFAPEDQPDPEDLPALLLHAQWHSHPRINIGGENVAYYEAPISIEHGGYERWSALMDDIYNLHNSL